MPDDREREHQEDPFLKVREELKDIADIGEEPQPEVRISNELPQVPEWDYQRKNTGKSKEKPADYRGLGYGLTIAYTMVGPLIAGYGIGYLIDKKQGDGNTWQTWLTIAGMVLGFIGALFLMTKANETKNQ